MTKSFVVLVMSFMTFCSPEIYMGISRLGKVSCSKRQSLLNSLSANQLFHLDPYMDGWCQKISLSDKIYNELTTSAHELPIDWSSIMTTITAKLTGYFNKSEEPKETKLIVVNTTFNSTTVTTPIEANATETNYLIENGKPNYWFPETLKMAWSDYKSNAQNENQLIASSQWIYCQSAYIPLIVKKPSWWFFAFDNCDESMLDNENRPLITTKYSYLWDKIAYRITLRNGEYGDFFREHFSTQEFGKLEIDLVFSLFLGSLFLMANLLFFHLYRSKLLHPTIILWYSSVGLRFLAQLIQLIVDVNFAKTGYFNPFNTSLAKFFYALSISCFYASLLVLGSGFTTIYQSISRNHKIIFIILTAIHTLVNIICQILIELTHYEVHVFSRYHSSPGFVYLGLQLCSYIVYIFISSYTCIKWSAKRILLIKFMAVSSIWFWTVPLWMLICLNYVHNWYIETFIRIWEELIHLTGFIVMMIFLRPEKINTIFPYHANSLSTDGDQRNNEDWKAKLVTESISKSSSPASASKTPSKSITTTQKSAEQSRDNEKIDPIKKVPPKRPNPPRLFNLTGKPGDLPAPGTAITSGLTELSKTTTEVTKRPQTTPTLSSSHNDSPRLKPIDKASSAY